MHRLTTRMCRMVLFRLPPFYFIFLVLVSSCFWSKNSNGATHWRLEDGEVNVINEKQEDIFAKDPLFQILTSSSIHSPAKDSDNASSDIIVSVSDGDESASEETEQSDDVNER